MRRPGGLPSNTKHGLMPLVIMLEISTKIFILCHISNLAALEFRWFAIEHKARLDAVGHHADGAVEHALQVTDKITIKNAANIVYCQ